MSETTTDNKSPDALAAIVFAAFAITALVAFLAFRGADIGSIPELAKNLGGGPFIGSEGLRDSALGLVIALAIGISWYGVGALFIRLAPVERTGESSFVLEFALKTAIGAAIWSLLWFFLGLIGMYNGTVAALALIAGIAAAIHAYVVRSGAKYEEDSPTGAVDNLLFIFIAIPVLLALISSLAPPIAKDTLLYHFAVPKAFIAQNSSAFIDGNIASYLALGTEMHVVWAMLLGGLVSDRAAETAAGATIFLFFPILLFAIYGWTRQIGLSRTWGLVAAAAVAAVPTAYHVASSGYIDIALALFVTLAIYELSRWWRFQENGSLLIIAILLGGALSIKLTALFVVAAFALVILLRAREAKDDAGEAGRLIAGGFAALFLAGVIASPWYVRTWKATGSPVFPFYMSIWEGKANGWDVERSNLFQAMNSQYGGSEKGAVDYLFAPVNVSVTAQPEIHANFDGVLGVAFLMGLPILIWALWKFDVPIEAKIGAGVAAIMFMFWLFSSQQLRYLLPIVPALAVAIAASAQVISEKRRSLGHVFRFALLAPVVAGLLTSTAWFMQKAPLRAALGGETRDQYLTRNLDYFPFYQALQQESRKDDKVWLINMRRDTYYVDRPVFSDYLFEDWTLRKMVWESKTLPELRAKTAAMGVNYVLTRHDFLFDYDRSSLVDDKKPRAENEAKLKLAKDLVLDPANTVKADKKFSLVKVS